MEDFLEFFESVKNRFSLSLSVYYSSICSWCIQIKHNDLSVVYVEDCDMQYSFAKAQVLLKDWLSDKFGGY
ncbi:hypothetical protein BFS06_13510 [Clostridium perfringens]|uniref:Uncharacterized protein n=1 Tax=Clostridium perfringens TaxID=1502 RepID=A0A140GRX1_CLOPF|nr:hypothetical protein [Clostridium perfringens]AMN31280.1 hypothetical protein JFP838_pA0364 [Clostridium perfringens]TBX14224.1 hypothetical protein BFS06_13510 [Clostridium perfringens]